MSVSLITLEKACKILARGILFLHVRGFALSVVYVKEDHIAVLSCQGNHPSRIHVIVYVRAQSDKITLLLKFVFLGK